MGDYRLIYVPLSLDSPPDLPRKPAVLQDFQVHLNPAPESIGAREAWLTHNANGQGMKFIDLERGWVLNHENFINPATAATVFAVADPGTSQFSTVNTEKAHGASVLGTLAAPDFGGNTIGIAFRASGQVVSINRLPGGIESIHDAITVAARMLSPGDVLLIEAQVKDSVLGLWPVEANSLEYQEIRTVVGNHIVVIEPAGNGHSNSGLGASGNDLDLFTFPGTVAHILDRNSREEFRADSGAIMEDPPPPPIRIPEWQEQPTIQHQITEAVSTATPGVKTSARRGRVLTRMITREISAALLARLQ